MATLLRACFTLLLLLPPLIAQADDKHFTLLHTNDWQSRLLGFGPNLEYTPQTTHDDKTTGGIARLATKIKTIRAQQAAGEPLMLLDGGDFSMGTLFHTITRETGAELQLMQKLGYDAITLGNHEFDFRPDGLAQMIRSAHQAQGAIPPIVISNLFFSESGKGDASLKAVYDDQLIRRKLVLVKDGIRFGFFGLIGVDARNSAPNAKPVRIDRQIDVAKSMVTELKQQDKVDVVILLSHSGVVQNSDGLWTGEEVEYARQVPGIDIIIGGHSHTPIFEPIMINGTPIVQAGSDGQYLGEMSARLTDNGIRMTGYKLHPINDKIPGDPEISKMIAGFKAQVSEKMLTPRGYHFDQPLVKTPADLGRDYDDPRLGNLVTDAIRKATGADIGLTGNGTLRDDILQGETGVQAVSDIFRIQPLGIGEHDDEPGYPLMKAWLTGPEVKSLLEVLLLGYQTRSDAYYPRLSGIRFTYNNFRPPFDRVTRVELGDPVNGYTMMDLSDKSDRLYSIGGTSYVGSFTWIIPDISHGLLSVTPKYANGQPIANIRDAILDISPETPGIQEMKIWQAMLDYLGSLPDLDSDGLSDIPLDSTTTEQRMIADHSLNPAKLFSNSTWILWTTLGLLIILISLLGWLLTAVGRRLRR
ncbi:bifunctional UDP-sugar hydrolase/5'-nucleotidase [Kistimonas scapharcae]|uniref:bifunctional metallophosphatase/5'-nucleotidase n=1 Tax=Kistimonas scapharcae TaxID=1036133 RepID=UPI0031E9D3E3